MEHRHIKTAKWSATAIDDVIERGKRADWRELRLAIDADLSLAPIVLKVCRRRCEDPQNQRHFGWRNYVQSRIA